MRSLSWRNDHLDGPSPKPNRQDLHLDERAGETVFGELLGLRSCFAKGKLPCVPEGLQHGNEVRHVFGQAKPRRPMRL